jgi:hypothetical protein
MKRLIFSLLLALAAASVLPSEAVVLGAGTSILEPDGTSLVLQEPRFLLDRSDMELATSAMIELDHRLDQIDRLEQSYANLRSLTIFLGGSTIILSLAFVGALLWR